MSKPAVPRRGLRPMPGQGVVELAVLIPLLVLMLAVGADLARAFFMSITVASAARAGAQYGSHSLTTAADSAGMQTAAVEDGANVRGLSATASQCTCQSGSAVASCPSSYCTNNPQATFVQVNTQAVFTSIMHYPGLPGSLTLTGQAIMQVQQ